jgi:outer membrane protein
VEVRRLVLEANENQLKVAERRYEVGEVAIAAVARFRSEVAAARQALVVATGDAALAKNRLARLANLPEIGELVAGGPVPIPEGEEQELERTALAERLEMQVLMQQIKAAGIFVKVEKGAALPELDAAAQYYSQKAGFPANDWMSLSFILRVPIYQGGLVKANVAKAREDLREIELLEQTVRRTIEDQVDSSLLAFEAADAVLDAATERNKAARLSYRQVEAAYRVGEASTIDLLDATTEAADAETAQIIARAQRQFQAISLRYSIGLPPLPDLDFRAMSDADNQEN